MANMGYCRFINTLEDLQDCLNHMDDSDLSEAEQKAREGLIELCGQISDSYRDEDDESEDMDEPSFDPMFLL